MIDWRLALQFIRFYFQPSMRPLQAYLMIFIGVSFLSFATFLRDFYSIPALVLQLLSPFVAPLVLYILPASLLSASVLAYTKRQTPGMDESLNRKLIRRFRRLNIGLPLVLSAVYLLVFLRYVRGEFDFGSFGIWYGLLAVPGVIGGSALGDYAAYVAMQVLSEDDAPKSKRKRDHRLQDVPEDEGLSLEDHEENAQQQSGRQL